MSQVQIVAIYENYERILSDYARDLKRFLSEMESLVTESEGIIASLNSSWQGESYDKFARTSRKGFDEIRASLSVVKNISGEIDQKVPQIERIIRQLKGED